MEGTRVSGQGFGFVGGRFWQLAVLAATGTLGVTSQTEAAVYYWQDSTPGLTQPAPQSGVRRAKTHRHGEKKSVAAEKEQSKPQGPLVISISIAQQKLRLYDANGLYAESPISTGMPGHSTPMGVFSVIQKQKLHHSNIYSGAPMPYMQRITWSGIAIHAGVLPGYPASHGCIRMPMAFAMKMWNWTKMGARVIVTPGDVSPASFSHPLLAAVKVQPQPVAVEETKADVVAVHLPVKQMQVAANAAPLATEAKLELRSTVGHADDMKPAADESHLPATSRLKTAGASGALPPATSTSTTPDAVPTNERAAQAVGETDASKSEIDSNAAKPDEAASSNEKSNIRPAEISSNPPAKPEAATSEAVRPNGSAMEARAEAGDLAEKPADTVKAAISEPATPPVATNNAPLKEDLKRDFTKTAASRPDLGAAIKNTGQIAVFVSRKDSKLYVRQNFSPLFNVPVTIAADDRPLGTHIFTARVDSNDASVLHWSVVSLPVPAKAANRRAEEERSSRGRRIASEGPIEVKLPPVPDSPAEALDRLGLPAEVMVRIYQAVSTGGSMIISDQGIAAGETGEGTDFIVSLR